MIQGESWVVNSEHTKTAYKAHVDKLFEEHRYLTFPKPRIGQDRSLDQNSLFHVWATEYVAHLLKKNKRMVTKAELAGMKRTIKAHYYRESGAEWMVHKIKNFFSGEEKTDYRSSSDYKRGEMFDLLTWLQIKAAGDGLVLESKGEYAKLQREQHAA